LREVLRRGQLEAMPGDDWMRSARLDHRLGPASCGPIIALAAVFAAAVLLLSGCAASEGDPCAGIECSSRGFCIVDYGQAYCVCMAGFHPRGLACEANSGCLGVDCAGHGTCELVAEVPECACQPGYHHPLDYPLLCVADRLDGGADGADDGAGCVPGATERCNGRDDDCDGLTDETFDLDFDEANCGSCGHVCLSGPRGRPNCVLGECAVTCDAGWSDLDGDPATGCEAPCTPVVPADESLCEGRDDDCDGLTDEDWASAETCGLGACERGAICFRGSFTCRPRVPPAASDPTCDGFDDDCDGRVDEDAAGCAADADADVPDTDASDVTEAEASLCGNGVVDPGEACEAPDSQGCGDCGSQSCGADCQWAACDDPGFRCDSCDSGQCYNRRIRQDSGCGCNPGICSANCGLAGDTYDVSCGGTATCDYRVESPGYEFNCSC
jgi:hypothetical protein